MDNRYSTKRTNKFYALIKKRKKEIRLSDISEDKKEMLYKTIDETIERYEKNRENYLISRKDSEEILESIKSLDSLVLRFNSEAKKLLGVLEDNNTRSK